MKRFEYMTLKTVFEETETEPEERKRFDSDETYIGEREFNPVSVQIETFEIDEKGQVIGHFKKWPTTHRAYCGFVSPEEPLLILAEFLAMYGALGWHVANIAAATDPRNYGVAILEREVPEKS